MYQNILKHVVVSDQWNVYVWHGWNDDFNKDHTYEPSIEIEMGKNGAQTENFSFSFGAFQKRSNICQNISHFFFLSFPFTSLSFFLPKPTTVSFLDNN